MFDRRLVSQYEQVYGVSEADEAKRLVRAYGLHRACQLAEVFAGQTTPKPLRAFWFHVDYLLSQERNEPTPRLPKEHEGYKKKSHGPLTVTVNGVKVSRAEFYRRIKANR